jgi:hypothetical protein
MLHPSTQAVNYIWEAFAKSYLDNNTFNTWREIVKITRACNHRPHTDSTAKIKSFAEAMLKQISTLKIKFPLIDFSREEDHFLKMRNM